MWYNPNCLDEQNTGALCFQKAAGFPQSIIVGKVPSISGIRPGCSSRQRQQASGGHFAMKEIKLTQGKAALVDDDMFDYLNQWKWRYLKGKHERTGYAVRNEGNRHNRKMIRMHVVIMKPPPGMEIDHVDLNGCNNQRYNLRICTHSQNQMNINKRRDNTSGYKGVTWNKWHHSWYAFIRINGRRISLGYFYDPKDAARAYDCKAIELFGESARINDI